MIFRRAKPSPGERLQAVALMRMGYMHRAASRGSHRELRQTIDPSNLHGAPVAGDVEGFVTSAGRFLSRAQAVRVGIEAGQLPADWRSVRRELLSSDINW